MKNKLFTLILLLPFVFSCAADKTEGSSDLSEITLGDSMLRNESIVDEINENCVIDGDFFGRSESEVNDYNKRCIWSKLTYDYTEINHNNKIRELFKNESDRLYIKNFPAPKSNAVPGYYSYLFLEKNGAIQDSILIYKEDNYGEALVVETTLFLIENNFLITMEVEDDESGTFVNSYNKYTIDIEKGKFTRILSKQPKRKSVRGTVESEETNTIETKYQGVFYAGVDTEATTTGMARIGYTFTITNENVQLETNTYHEPIRCNGIYQAEKKGQVLELYFTGSEESCDTENPLFYLKEEKGELYVKGLGGEGTNNDWIKLTRE